MTSCNHCLQDTAVAMVSCSAQTTAANIIQKLEQMCGNPVSTNTARVLRPRVRHSPPSCGGGPQEGGPPQRGTGHNLPLKSAPVLRKPRTNLVQPIACLVYSPCPCPCHLWHGLKNAESWFCSQQQHPACVQMVMGLASACRTQASWCCICATSNCQKLTSTALAKSWLSCSSCSRTRASTTTSWSLWVRHLACTYNERQHVSGTRFGIHILEVLQACFRVVSCMHKYEARLLSACLFYKKSWTIGISAMITQTQQFNTTAGCQVWSVSRLWAASTQQP